VVVVVGFVFTSAVAYVLLDGYFDAGSAEQDLVRLVLEELLSHAFGHKIRLKVGHPGLEPGTSVLSGLRSNLLS
jgi:hypothetical protein